MTATTSSPRRHFNIQLSEYSLTKENTLNNSISRL
jgi:hypothetical protein